MQRIMLLLFTLLLLLGIRPIFADQPATAVIDNESTGYDKNGEVGDWNFEAEGGFRYGFDWTYSNRNAVPNPNTVYWLPSLTAPGNYRVEVYIPTQFATTTNARYFVLHQGRRTHRAVNQLANQGRWVTLGTFFMGDTNRDGVMLDDVTYENAISQVAFDAVRFVPANQPSPPQEEVPRSAAKIRIYPKSGRVGEVATAYGSSFTPNERVYLLVDGVVNPAKQQIALPNGTVAISFIVPNVPSPLVLVLQSDTQTALGHYQILP